MYKKLTLKIGIKNSHIFLAIFNNSCKLVIKIIALIHDSEVFYNLALILFKPYPLFACPNFFIAYSCLMWFYFF